MAMSRLYTTPRKLKLSLSILLDTQVSLAPTHVSPSVSSLVILLKLLESKGTHDDLSCCSELPESTDGNASGVHEGLNARAMYMKA